MKFFFFECETLFEICEIKDERNFLFRSSLMVNVKSLWNPFGVYHRSVRYAKSSLILFCEIFDFTEDDKNPNSKKMIKIQIHYGR